MDGHRKTSKNIQFTNDDDTLLFWKFANNRHDCAQSYYFLHSVFLRNYFFFFQDMKNQLKVDFTVGTQMNFHGMFFFHFNRLNRGDEKKVETRKWKQKKK